MLKHLEEKCYLYAAIFQVGTLNKQTREQNFILFFLGKEVGHLMFEARVGGNKWDFPKRYK